MAIVQHPNAHQAQPLLPLISQPLTGPISDLTLLQQSLLFAELSQVAYGLPDQITASSQAAGFQSLDFLEQDNAQAYLLTTQYDCIVVFRGTEPENLEDIRASSDAVLVIAETLGRVHRGFKREVDLLWQPLEKLLKDNQKPLWFCGHSLGGALAIISAGRCVLSPIPSNPKGLFSFGSPRVGNRKFINFVKLNHYRWVNNNDIVTRLPPRWLGYSHSGRELYMNAYGQVREYTRWNKFRDRWLGFYLTLRQGRFDHVADHSISSYIQNLRQAVADEA
ncbi:MAG: lipase family protein [Pirellulaceae bacterium]|nr:lipase family protein [Pirellulaceae bacterium]